MVGDNVNIYDIAKAAGVSTATVSRVINEKDNVTEKTRQRILSVMSDMGYTPSAIARGMVSRSLQTIAVLTRDLRLPSHALTAYEVEQWFSSLGYHVVVCNTGVSREVTLKSVKTLKERLVDGFIFVGSVFDQFANDQELLSAISDVPTIIANGSLPLPVSGSVYMDDGYGIAELARHMISSVDGPVAYVLDHNTASAAKKRDAFIKVSRELQPELDYDAILSAHYGLEGGAELADKIIANGMPWRGLVFGEDLTAVGAMRRFLDHGLLVPQDIAISGYNNDQCASICRPMLTTGDNRAADLGKVSAEQLNRLINGESIEKVLVLKPKLMLRDTI